MNVMGEQCESCVLPEKTIDDCYNQVIKRLTDRDKINEVSSQLMDLQTNSERALFVYRVIKDLTFLPVVRTNNKLDVVAVYYRRLGNEFFNNKKYIEAYQTYNLSLLYADTNSENFIYAVSNRSAVFFGMEKYEECLEDIRFVFSTDFPEKIRQKLKDRKEQCLAKLASKGPENENDTDENDIIIDEILSLKGPRDPKYVSASSKLKVVFSKTMGRHVIAKEDIKVGEVLAQEDPYLTVLLEDQLLFCCAYCLSRKMNLYPCMTCTYTLYCSVECRETAYEQYHQTECRLLPSLLGMDFSKMDMLALRTLLRSRSDKRNWKEVFDVQRKAEARQNTDLWGCVKVGNKWVYDSQYYTPVHTLATNVEKRSLHDLFRKSLNAAVLTHFLSVIRYLSDNDGQRQERVNDYVAGTLLLHIMTSPTNMHSISANIANAEGKYVDECNIASGAYPFLSLLNHSCAPNVVRYSKLGTSQMSLIAIRPIKKGMQIYDNYGYHHALQNRESRQECLKFQYKFSCSCEACLGNWPMHSGLEECSEIPARILRKKRMCTDPDVIEKLAKGDKETAVSFYQPLCELIEALDPFAPCKELAECQESLKQCLAIFHGLVPYEYTQRLEYKPFPPCQSTGGPPHFAGYISGPAI